MATATSCLSLASCLGNGLKAQEATLNEGARGSSTLPFSWGLRHVSSRKVFLPARPTSAGRGHQVFAQTVSAPAETAIEKAKQVGIERTILLQGFRWFYWKNDRDPDQKHKKNWWKYVQSRIPDFQTAGFTHLWLPPPSQSADVQGYMPGEWYDLNNSAYGSQADLSQLNKDLLRANVIPVCDIVINHRTGSRAPDSAGRWDIFHGPDGGREIIVRGDPSYGGEGNADTGDDFHAAPDLDHTNPTVQRDIKNWLNWLIREMGFGGFRFDMVKGYAGVFLKDYVQSTTGPGVFNVVEFWDGDRQKVVNYVDSEGGIATAFDFPLKFILQGAINDRDYSRLAINGQPAGLLGFWPQRSTAFVDNHDTAIDKDAFPPDHVITGYAYILSHPCIPSVFWPHYFDWGLGAAINVLIQVRTRNNITANSKVKILAAESDIYVARIDDTVLVKLGPRWNMGSLLPDASQGWRLAASGTDYAIWDKSAPLRQFNIAGSNMVPLL